MPPESLRVSTVIPSTPEHVFDAWLDGARHALMTGAGARGRPEVGARFTAWDGYITGENLALERARRIVQAWRTTEFPEAHGDSRLEIQLEPDAGGTRVTILHSNIPEGQGASYEQGWAAHYLVPMAKYFERAAAKPAKAKPKPSRTGPAREARAKAAAAKARPARRAKPARKAKPKPKPSSRGSRRTGARGRTRPAR